MGDQIKKKQRAANYSNKEIHLLMNSIKPEIKIIENKKTDAVTVADKQKAWERVTAFFNMNSESSRDVNSLKLKYENIKKLLKKKMAQNKQNYRATGGGSASTITLEWYEEFLLTLLQIGITGLPSQGDCDEEDNVTASNLFEEHPEAVEVESTEHEYNYGEEIEIITIESSEKNLFEEGSQETLNEIPDYSRRNVPDSASQAQSKNMSVNNHEVTVELDGHKAPFISSEKGTPQISLKSKKRKRRGVTQEDKKNNFDSFMMLAERKRDVAKCQEECYRMELEIKKGEKTRSENKGALEEKLLEIEIKKKTEEYSQLLEERNHREKLMRMKEEEQKLKIELLKHELHVKIQHSLGIKQ